MPVSSPLPTDTRSKLADWVELLSLASSRNMAARADVLGLFDLLGEDDEHQLEYDTASGEALEGEILEDGRASLVDSVLDELQYRSDVLGDYYPFDISFRGQQWRIARKQPALAPLDQAAQACYVFCLLTSGIRDRSIRGVNLPPLEQAMANHFQAIAAESAADVIGGESVSFGWPRPEGTGFQPALADMSRKLRLGKPLDAVPLWSNGHEKDAGIDVIAWRDFVDRRPGKMVLLGQVASGHNWVDKTVHNDTPRFLSWFSERPMQHFIPAIFIPFPQHHSCQGKQDEDFQAVAAAQAWLREQEFGLVVDRLRIVGSAARRILGEHHDEGHQLLRTVDGWIAATIVVAKEAA